MESKVRTTVIIGQIIHCVQPYKLEVLTNGFLIALDNGKIAAVGQSSSLEETKQNLNLNGKINTIRLSPTQLLIPGLVDCHIHAPQYPNSALGYDKPLLEWLELYTFPLEKQFKDLAMCRTVFDAIVRKTLDFGTTTACYFGSLYKDSTLVLVDSVLKYGQRALVGKINMIRNCPADYCETERQSLEDTVSFVKEVSAKPNNNLVKAVITPRFAPHCDMALMTQLGALAKTADVHVQTHIAENRSEVAWVRELYNDSYANVYGKANLLTAKTVLAHGVYLDDKELDLIKSSGTSIAHCPESNCFLKSGICDVVRLRNKGIDIGLGTDISGGASPSIISTMKSAVTASVSLSFSKDESYKPLTYVDAFYMATLGGARALAWQEETGNFVIGKSFDALIVDLNPPSSSSADLFGEHSAEELLQKFVFLGDDRNVIKVFVDGRIVK